MANENYSLDQVLAKFLEANEEMDPTLVDAKTLLSEIPEWDSLAILVTTTMLETEFGVEIKGDALRRCESIQDVAKLIESEKNG